MLVTNELLFGQIAVTKKFITQEQLGECLKLQLEKSRQLSIGKILLKHGYIKPGQIEKVLDQQEENLREAATYSPRKKLKDRFFGTLAVTMKYATLPQVVESLQEQQRLERMNVHIRLGEVFVSKGYMTVDEVRNVLEKQKKRPPACVRCGRPANVLADISGGLFYCRDCADELNIVEDPGFGE